MIAVIPKGQIRKIGIYVNNERLSMAQVKKNLGCQYVLNAGLYEMTKFQPINHLTVDGEVLSSSGNPFGYAIRDNTMVFSYGNNVKYPTFIGAYPVLVRHKKRTGDTAPPGLEGFRARSAVGLKDDGSLVLYCTRSNRSLDGIAEDLLAAGCDTAINLDGGGSSQCDFNGRELTSSRIVHNYLCVWTADAPEGSGKKTEAQPGESDKLKILLISGHGADDPGATSKINGKTYREADESRKVAQSLAAALGQHCDVTVYPTDRNAFRDYQNGTLSAVAKFHQYDYVLEIHFNAFSTGASDGKTKGTEIFVTTAESGISVEQEILKNISALGLTDRGVKRKNWSVIHKAKQAGTSSALLEVCFIDDPDDMTVYTANREKIAPAIAGGILDGFGVAVKDDAETSERDVVREKAGLREQTMQYLDNYQYSEDLFKKLAAAMK